MEKETLKRIFDFLEEKGEQNAPVKWKLINNIPLKKEELNVKVGLDLSYTKIETLPEGLKVSGFLDLAYTFIESLPEGLKVGGHLDLIGTDIKFLPKGLEVGRNLYIDDSPLIKYSDNQLREMIRPGFIKGKIFK
jgi:hypothetical protein